MGAPNLTLQWEIIITLISLMSGFLAKICKSGISSWQKTTYKNTIVWILYTPF